MPPQGAAVPPPPPPPPQGATQGQWTYPPILQPKKTNTMAIVALVCAFVCSPAGLVLGIMARREITRNGEDGDSLALAAIIISAVSLALGVLMLVFFVVFFAAVVTHLPENPQPTGPNGFSLRHVAIPFGWSIAGGWS